MDPASRAVFAIGGAMMLIPSGLFASAIWVTFAGVVISAALVSREVMNWPRGVMQP